MKLIISFQDGRTEIVSVASVDAIQFIASEIHIIGALGNSKDYFASDIRSIVIA